MALTAPVPAPIPRIALSMVRREREGRLPTILAALGIPIALHWTTASDVPRWFLPQYAFGMATAQAGNPTIHEGRLYVIMAIEGQRIVIEGHPIMARIDRLTLIDAQYVDLET